MEFPSTLTQAVLLKRHKRFLAEVIINNQEHRVIYCPNVGAMTGCDILGSRIWYSRSLDPHRRFPETWELVEVDVGHLVCVNTQHASNLLIEAIDNNTIPGLQGYGSLQLHPPLLGEHGFDILLKKDQEKCFVILHNVTLGDEIHRGFFPDALSDLGVEQLKSLIHAKQQGYRAVLVYCVLHTGIDRIFPADHIDPDYGCLLRQALLAGVEVMGFRCEITLKDIHINGPVEICVPVRMIGDWRSEKSNK
jgi:sugar fermentation stimulation protein A